MTFDHARLWFSFTCIAEGCASVPSLWKEFDEANIGTLLEQRYHSGKLRKAGIRTKGPNPLRRKIICLSSSVKRQLTKVYQVQKIVGNEGILFMLEYIKGNRETG